MEQRRFSKVSILLTVSAFVCLVAAASTGSVRKRIDRYGDLAEFGLRILLLTVAVWLVWRLFKRHRKSFVKPVSAGPEPAQPSIDRLMRLQSSIVENSGRTYSTDTVSTFAKMVTSPALYRTRVTENIDFEERIVTQRIAIEYALPEVDESAKGPRFVLLFAPKKGEIVDNLKITDGSGKPLADLSFEESTELVAAGLRLLLQLAIRSGKKRSLRKGSLDLDESQRALELILLELLTRRGVVDRDEIDDRMETAFQRYAFTADAATMTELRSYISALSAAYPIVAVVPKESMAAGRSLLRYERTLIPTALTERGLNSGWLRVLLGLKPNQVVVPVHLAATAGSFHLYVNGPSNKYVLEQKFRCHNCKQGVTRSWVPIVAAAGECSHRSVQVPKGRRFTDVDRHFRVTPKLGQSFAHLYTRDFGGGSSPRFQGLELFARFKETPPGSRATAVVTALVSTFLLAIMGRLASNAGTPPSSLPALALALPAAAATWFGFSTDSRSLVGSSMLARLSQIVTAIVSAVAIAVYFTTHDGRLWGDLSIVGIKESWWVALFLISAVNLLYVSYRFALKVQVYNGLLRKKERPGYADPDKMRV